MNHILFQIVIMFRYLYAQKVISGEEWLTLFAYTKDRNKYPMTYDVEFALEAKNSNDRFVVAGKLVIAIGKNVYALPEVQQMKLNDAIISNFKLLFI